MKLKVLVLCLLLFVPLVGCGGGGGGDETTSPLTNPSASTTLYNLLNGQTIYFENMSDGTEVYTGQATFNSNGTYTEIGVGSVSGAYQDNGTWAVSGNQLMIGTGGSQRIHTYVSSDSSGIVFDLDGIRYTANYQLPNPQTVDVAGTWDITETMGANTCGDTVGLTDTYQVTVSQNGSNLTVTAPAGTFNGTMNSNVLSWTGSYPEQGGTTTITGMSLIVSLDRTSFSGTVDWTWTDGNYSCVGENSADGIKGNGNNLPIADPGSDLSVTYPVHSQLDGGNSSDPDGDFLTYNWTLISRPAGSSLSVFQTTSTSVNPIVSIDAPGEYIFQLIVNDGIDDSLPSTVKFTSALLPTFSNFSYSNGRYFDAIEILNGNYLFVGRRIYADNSGTANKLALRMCDVNGNDIFATSWHNSNGFDLEGFGAVATSDGGFAVVGVSKIASYPNSFSDLGSAFIFKFDSSGNLLWEKMIPNIGGVHPWRAHSVIEDDNADLVVVGVGVEDPGMDYLFNHEKMFLYRTDSGGNEILAKTYGQTDTASGAKGVALTVDGGYLLVGYSLFTSGLAGGQQPPEWATSGSVIVKLDSLGNRVWIKYIGHNIDNRTESTFEKVRILPNGDILTSAGPHVVKLDSSGNELARGTFDNVKDFITSADNGIIFVQGEDIVKLSSDMQITWKRTPFVDPHLFYSIDEATDGGFIIGGGRTTSGGNVFEQTWMKTDSSGYVARQ